MGKATTRKVEFSCRILREGKPTGCGQWSVLRHLEVPRALVLEFLKYCMAWSVLRDKHDHGGALGGKLKIFWTIQQSRMAPRTRVALDPKDADECLHLAGQSVVAVGVPR